MAGTFWTPEEEDLLKRMVDEGFNLMQMMSVLKSRNEHSIRSKAQSMGLSLSFATKPAVDLDEFANILKKLKEPECL